MKTSFSSATIKKTILNEKNKTNYKRKINLKTKSTLTRRFKDFDRINLAKSEQKDKQRIEEQQEMK